MGQVAVVVRRPHNNEDLLALGRPHILGNRLDVAAFEDGGGAIVEHQEFVRVVHACTAVRDTAAKSRERYCGQVKGGARAMEDVARLEKRRVHCANFQRRVSVRRAVGANLSGCARGSERD